MDVVNVSQFGVFEYKFNFFVVVNDFNCIIGDGIFYVYSLMCVIGLFSSVLCGEVECFISVFGFVG